MAGVREDEKGPGRDRCTRERTVQVAGTVRRIGVASVCRLVLTCEEDQAERCSGRLEQAGALVQHLRY